VEDHDLVPKCARRLNGRDLGDCQINVSYVIGYERANFGLQVRVESRLSAAFDTHGWSHICVRGQDAGISEKERLAIGVGIIEERS
jgi:hypothetical protein